MFHLLVGKGRVAKGMAQMSHVHIYLPIFLHQLLTMLSVKLLNNIQDSIGN